MTDQEPDDFNKQLGRLPEGHGQLLGQMPKPDIENAGSYSLTRLIVLAAIVFLGLAIFFLVLPGLVWPR